MLAKNILAKRKHLFSAITALIASSPSYANLALEEVVVTAQKRETALQDTPVAISAFSNSRLEEAGVQDLRDVTAMVPSLSISTPATGAIYYSLRGVGNETPTPGGDNGVATHVDGVYIGRPIASLMNMWDAERLEILRGPQGTLYGRNATGGSINLISSKPNLDEFSAKVDFTYGNYDLTRFRGAVNIPLSDTVAARTSLVWTDREGYQKNIGSGPDGDDDKSWVFRGGLLLSPSDSFETIISVVAADTSGAGYQPKVSNSTLPVVPVMFAQTSGGALAGPPILFNPNTTTDVISDERTVNINLHERRTNIEVEGLTATLSWDFDSFSVKTIASHYDILMERQQEQDHYNSVLPDPNTAPAGTYFRPGSGPLSPSEIALITPFIGQESASSVYFKDDAKQSSFEINISSNDSEDLEWIVGALYYKETVDRFVAIDAFPFRAFTEANPFNTGPSIPGCCGFRLPSDIETESFAIFGQGTYHLSDTVRLTLGARWSQDSKKANIEANIGPAGLFGATDTPEKTWREPTVRTTLDWDWSESSMLYFSFARGYKAGSINMASPNPATNTLEPEVILNYEIGSKNRLWEDRAELNITAYYSDYSDLQVNVFTLSGSQLENAEKAIIYGLELDFMAVLTDNLRVNGALAYTNAEFDKYITSNPFTGEVDIDASGNKLNRTPEWAFNVGASYQLPIKSLDGELTLRIDYTWKDETYHSSLNTENTLTDSWHKTNARLSYISPNDTWNAEIYVENIEDDSVANSRELPPSFPAAGSPVQVNDYYNPPRTMGIRIGYNFY